MWVSILVVVPFRVHYIISLLSKNILLVLNGDFVMIISQNMGCCWSATKYEKWEKSAKCVKKKCEMSIIGCIPLFIIELKLLGWETGLYCLVAHLGLYSGSYIGCAYYGLIDG